eukprot:m.50999 g.50999  ORF g.50999 m.50999 type:complete len:1070 (+) comp10700_c0_seq3:46-3255(+)
MSAKAIGEATGKNLLAKQFGERDDVHIKFAELVEGTDMTDLVSKNPWLALEKLVAKPDQLIKRRGKLGLIKVNAELQEAKAWIDEKMNSEVQIGSAKGKLTRFIIEPFVAHKQEEEYYICIYASRNCDTILFTHEGGVDVGDVDAKALKVDIPVTGDLTPDQVNSLLANIPKERQEKLSKFITELYTIFREQFFTYLEINPLVMKEDGIYILDLAAKLDQTAEFMCHSTWGEIEFPPPFGRDMSPEEAFIAGMDAKSGASLKLTVLNAEGRIWTMVAGGGASVVYSDTICDLGGASELANYGEYSGAPSQSQTYEYCRTILNLMLKKKHPEGKVLILGGGIANFTNIASTFKGVCQAFEELHKTMLEHNIKVYVRRGGPNYQEGLATLRKVGEKLKLPMYVYGPEQHMTSICSMALGLTEPPEPKDEPGYLDQLSAGGGKGGSGKLTAGDPASDTPAPGALFSKQTKSLVFGIQQRAVQGMLDFDHCCGRKTPSVAGMIYPFSGNHSQKFYWGNQEIMLPVYQKMSEAMEKNPGVDVLISFASLRSAYDSAIETMGYPQIRTIAIIAEGIPENLTRKLNSLAAEKGITIIGPATVGGVKPGCFKIGNTGGMIDNIISSKLYRPGSVAYVSRSGGMSNELNNMISRNTNGVYEGVAIGGDRYPGSTFIDHLFRYEADPAVKMMVLLGEVGGTEEYGICEAIKEGKIKKPIVAWCIGTCARMFGSDVQFGHAGACANGDAETAIAKNKALASAGAVVPASFDSLPNVIKTTYDKLVEGKTIVPQREPPVPKVPIDYKWAQELGLIRKSANFASSISDDRGEELLYGGMTITDVFKDEIGIGGVISLLWFQKRLPDYANKFIEMCLMITADHGPAVSGAHNTIVTARAGKDLVSALCSGLLTIGDRFGGALDGAARMFSEAFDHNLTPREFVTNMRKQHKLIMGIGHKVKSTTNPDMRVTLIKQFVKREFPSCPLLNYAEQVEAITTAKKPNLILNVDGAIACAFVDLLRGCGTFSAQEANEYIQNGALNAIFILGRTTGLIGHYLDQQRLKQGLYRHPWDDISYLKPSPSQ